MLLSDIHETISESDEFVGAVRGLTNDLHGLTANMFNGLPPEVAASTKIGAPKRMKQMFQTLDFETVATGEETPKSLTRQRGDGVKVRHIPELLKFISDEDGYDFHIWGFEEPENSLDFVAAQAEATRFRVLAQDNRIQVLMTTHSPSFYMLDGDSVSKYYVRKYEDGTSEVIQGNGLNQIDVNEGIQEGFYLPAVAAALSDLSAFEERVKEAESHVGRLQGELNNIARPVVLTEGRTDARILETAWKKLREGDCPFHIRSCETGGENAGSGNGGATTLAIRIKGIAHDHPHPVLALFDLDEEGVKAYKLDRNFTEEDDGEFIFKRGLHGKSYAACLPAPDYRAECERLRNLPIEYLFSDEILETEYKGEKLGLERMQASRRVGTELVHVPLDDRTEYKAVTKNKDVFADRIVPRLEAEHFRGFEGVFEMIEAIFGFDAARA